MSDEPVRSRRLAVIGGLVALGALAAFALRAPPRRPSPVPPPAPQGPRGKATVAIYDDGTPMPDRWVVFHEPDGSVAAKLKSGPDGKASADVQGGSMITVAYGTSIRQLVTVAGVQPGDEVIVGEHDNDEAESGDTVALASVAFPGARPPAARYAVDLGVGVADVADVEKPVRMPILRRFLDPERRFATLGLAYDAKGDVLAFTFASSAVADGGDTVVRLPPWSTDWRDQRIVLVHAPAGVTTAKGDLAVLAGDARFDHVAHPMPLTAAEATLRFAVPRPLGETASYRVELGYGATDKAILVRRAKSLPSEVRIDLAETLLPRVSAPTTEATADRARPLVRWTTSAGGAGADAAILQLSWPETKEHVWTIIAPPTVHTGFQVPALPAELADWRPDSRGIRPAVALVEASEYAGYDDVRKKWIHLLGETPEEDATLRISMTGEIDF